MEHSIVKVDSGNYSKFDDMVYWRMKGNERLPTKEAVLPEKGATGIRLYTNNPGAKRLYEKCGFADSGSAYFMEKQ